MMGMIKKIYDFFTNLFNMHFINEINIGNCWLLDVDYCLTHTEDDLIIVFLDEISTLQLLDNKMKSKVKNMFIESERLSFHGLYETETDKITDLCIAGDIYLYFINDALSRYICVVDIKLKHIKIRNEIIKVICLYYINNTHINFNNSVGIPITLHCMLFLSKEAHLDYSETIIKSVREDTYFSVYEKSKIANKVKLLVNNKHIRKVFVKKK